ncbi:MAG: ParB N-terminal domain-containing protein [Eubacterium sp.]|nr:ParB N-terminal domain-containing protein [Eubacterium sp.]
MKIITKKLTELTKPEQNVRIHNENQLKEFERSIKMFGQIRPIVIDENNVILAGNGLYDTLVRMGKKEAECYQYKDLTENQKKKLMIADNKIFSLGIENLDTLNQFLTDLQGDLDIPGYDEDILRQMVADADAITERLSEYGTLDEAEIQNIRERNAVSQTAITPTDPGAEPVTPAASGVFSEVIQEEQDETTADIRRFVLCPKCGEKIWL